VSFSCGRRRRCRGYSDTGCSLLGRAADGLSGGAGDWQSLGRVLGSWIATMFRAIVLGAMYTDAIAAATLGSVVLASKLGIGLFTDLNACSIQTRRRYRRWSGSWMCAPRRRRFVEN